jgi:hypothetical protein
MLSDSEAGAVRQAAAFREELHDLTERAKTSSITEQFNKNK